MTVDHQQGATQTRTEREALATCLHLLDEAAGALAALDRVRALHVADFDDRVAGRPFPRCGGCDEAWPCPTTQAIAGTS